jgi:hypothetical protein
MPNEYLLGNEKRRFQAAKTITELETRKKAKEESWLEVKVKINFHRRTK